MKGNHNRPGLSQYSGWGLLSAVRQWPTPCALDARGGWINRSPTPGAIERPTLALAVRRWPTPTAMAANTGTLASMHRKDGKNRATGRLDYAVIAAADANGHLNPDWVEWLMGWPIGWTALEPLEMGRFREWLRQHGGC
ncbi:hypothetical protein [Paraburkholderia youngii]|uniref:hypothetical protein n=1 Tax=Paraburkholderia youngii TaxID=2782701 RepID=UPI003D2508C2